MVRLIYLCDSRLPSRSTSTMQIVQMCSAFQAAGAHVILLTPHYRQEMPEGFKDNLWEFYGVKDRFRIVQFKTPLSTGNINNKIFYAVVRLLQYSHHLIREISRSKQPVILYGRSSLGLWVGDWLRRTLFRHSDIRVYLELHDLPSGNGSRQFLQRLDGAVTISRALADAVMSRFKLPAERVLVEQDGMSSANLTRPPDGPRQRICSQLALDPASPLAVYTGRVNREKGAELLLALARSLQETGCQVVLVGKVYDPGYYTLAEAMPHARLVGFVPPSQVSDYQAAADILLLPSTPDLPYAAYTSPLKLFEYMASGHPIIASDLPVLREILRDGHNALLVPFTRPEQWAQAVRCLLEDKQLGRRLAAQALADVQEYTWEKRAQRILNFIDQTERSR